MVQLYGMPCLTTFVLHSLSLEKGFNHTFWTWPSLLSLSVSQVSPTPTIYKTKMFGFKSNLESV